MESIERYINEGIAIDASLSKSASRTVSNEKIEQLSQEHDLPKGRLNKNGNLKKFNRDIESERLAASRHSGESRNPEI